MKDPDHDDSIDTQLDNLVDFANRSVDFARYAFECGAGDFVVCKGECDPVTGEFVEYYKFKEFYLDAENFYFYKSNPYQVLSIGNKSYLMYEVRDIVRIWVCYTENEYRNKGYMTQLLKKLKSNFPDKTVAIDTPNEILKNSCIRIGIEVYRKN